MQFSGLSRGCRSGGERKGWDFGLINLRQLVVERIYQVNVDPVSRVRLVPARPECNGSGVELRTLNYENLGSNPVLRC